MLRWFLARIGFSVDPTWRELDRKADALGLPRVWVVCPHCGEQWWRLPPHGFEPCPIATALADAMGIKIDADRSAAIRMGVSAEEMWNTLRQRFEEEE